MESFSVKQNKSPATSLLFDFHTWGLEWEGPTRLRLTLGRNSRNFFNLGVSRFFS